MFSSLCLLFLAQLFLFPNPSAADRPVAIQVNGMCPSLNDLNGIWVAVDECATEPRKYYFMRSTSWTKYYMYWDPACDGGSTTDNYWLISSQQPILTRDKDLDDSGDCSNLYGYTESTADTPPTGETTWRLGCGGSDWTLADLTIVDLADCPAGQEATSPSSCSDCQAGKYNEYQNSACTLCAPGRYSETVRATSSDTCIACPPGKQTTLDRDTCSDCEPGSFAASEGSWWCDWCDSGRYSAAPAATSPDTCIACDPGKVSNSGSASCTICDPGSYSNEASSECKLCAPGEYSSSQAATSRDNCLACEAGKGSDAGSASCTNCEPGSYSTGNSTCILCSAGTYSEISAATSADVCVMCEAGKVSVKGAASETNCTACTSGKEPSQDQTSCVCGSGKGAIWQNPTGQLQDTTSIRIRARTNGESNYWGDDGSDASPTFTSDGEVTGRIEVKPSGAESSWGTVYGISWSWMYDDAVTTAKVLCRQIGNELGFHTVEWAPLEAASTWNTGPTTAPRGSGNTCCSIQCSGSEETLDACTQIEIFGDDHSFDAGIRCKFVKAEECEACPAGKFSSAMSLDQCVECEAGKYSSSTSATSPLTCLACGVDKASQTVGATTESVCTDCEPGKYSYEGSDLCISDRLASNWNEILQALDRGGNNLMDFMSNTLVEPGVYSCVQAECSVENGNMLSIDMQRVSGYIICTADSLSCVLDGKHGVNKENGRLIMRILPYISSGSSNGTLTVEGFKYFRGYSQFGAGAITFSRAQLLTLKFCSFVECSGDSYGTAITIQEATMQVFTTSFVDGIPSNADGSVQDITTNENGNVFISSECPPGWTGEPEVGLSIFAGSRPTMSIPEGSVTGTKKSFSIGTCALPCTVGQYLPPRAKNSSSFCQICGAGRFSPSGNWNGGCNICEAGTYLSDDATDATLHASCTLCPPGTQLPLKGFPSTGHDHIDDCEVCEAGTFNPSPGAASCSVCPNGKVNVDTSATSNLHESCSACPPGKWNSGELPSDHDRPNDCFICEAGQYSNNPHGATNCSDCEEGLSSSAGQQSCTICPAGYECDEYGAQKSCSEGNYSEEGVNERCKPCEKVG
mmetsp:Transcript_6475/g.11743  ORF Transcript_6475/g.11743 Transcript_6475/m.11743 type:complete len:1088 (+) Transcript_6475:165-3428(+)